MPPALPARDRALMETLLVQAERRLVPYHRALVRGLEGVPAGPVLYVGNHSGATYSGDTWIFAARLWRAHGLDALPYGLAHDLVPHLPVIGPALTRCGVVPARPEAAAELLAAGGSVMVYPGGDREAMWRSALRNVVDFGGRRGFIRTALAAGVPIVPIAAVGAHDTLHIFHDLPGLARLLGMDRRLRMKVWPLSFSIPWGLTLGPIPPYLPLPARIRIDVLPPIRFERAGAAAAADESYVVACAATVEDAIRAAVGRLAAEMGR